jgi:8-oxo-dGTP diphosphatase
MTLPGQRVQSDRYQLIPRTLVFLLYGDELLLIRIAADRGAWAGLCNGIGGHIEAGENPHSAAMREVKEETGITPTGLSFVGIIHVHTGSSPGIGIHIFVGQSETKQVIPSEEGEPIWIPLDALDRQPLVADLPLVIPRALEAYHQHHTFSGLTTFKADGQPVLQFMP